LAGLKNRVDSDQPHTAVFFYCALLKSAPGRHVRSGVSTAGKVFDEKIGVLFYRIRVPFKRMFRTKESESGSSNRDCKMFRPGVISD
jgi:hypothetical protein